MNNELFLDNVIFENIFIPENIYLFGYNFDRNVNKT